MMKYSRRVKRATKKFDYKLILVALVFSLVITTVIANGGNLQSQFTVGEDVATFKIAGISYEGDNYLSESAFKSSNPGAEVFAWKDHKKSFDIDGGIEYIGVTDFWTKDYVSDLNDFSGLAPDVTFELTQTPYLVDLDGNAKLSGYTEIKTRSDGSTQYMYWYKTQLKIRVDMGKIDIAGLDLELSSTDYFALKYDGIGRPMYGMGEFGSLRNINALLSVSLPEKEGYTFGWEMHVDATTADMIFSKDGTVYTEFDYNSLFSQYPEYADIWEGDARFFVNQNDNIQRSASGGEKYVPVEVSGKEVVSMGLTQALVPAIVFTDLTYFLLWHTGGTTSIWTITPVVYYDLIIKVAMVDVEIPTDPTNTTTTTTTNGDPWDPFKWEPILVDMDTTQLLLIGGGVFMAVITIGMLSKRRNGGGYSY